MYTYVYLCIYAQIYTYICIYIDAYILMYKLTLYPHLLGLIPIAADPNQFDYVVDEEETGDAFNIDIFYYFYL
jgi:hypothetical protein